MAKIAFEDLSEIRERHKNERLVFCSGCFDLMHAGHLLFFEDSKKQGDVLVVMVGSDEVIRRDKGPKRPVLNEHMRVKLIDALKPVDYVFVDRIISKDAHPLFFMYHVFDALKPDIYVINDDAFDIPYREELVAKKGGKLVILSRTAPPEYGPISTTAIIKKIKSL